MLLTYFTVVSAVFDGYACVSGTDAESSILEDCTYTIVQTRRGRIWVALITICKLIFTEELRLQYNQFYSFFDEGLLSQRFFKILMYAEIVVYGALL